MSRKLTIHEKKCRHNFITGICHNEFARNGSGLTPNLESIHEIGIKQYIIESFQQMEEKVMIYMRVRNDFIDIPELVSIGLNNNIVFIGIWKNRILFVPDVNFEIDHWAYIIRKKGGFILDRPNLWKMPSIPPPTTKGFKWEKKILWDIEIEVLVDGIKIDALILIQSCIRMFLCKRRVQILRYDPINLFMDEFSLVRKKIIGININLW